VSKEALCILTGLTTIAIKIEEAFQFYEYIRGSSKEEHWLIVTWELNTGITPKNDKFPYRRQREDKYNPIFIDGSKSEQVVGAGIAIFKLGNLISNLKYRLNKRCTNNQAEQLAILRELEYTENILVETEDKTATIHTDSRTTLDSLKSNNIHTLLIEEIRRKLENSILLS
jgi:hypothetical protein